MALLNKTILLIDDDEDFRILVAKILKAQGIKVLEADRVNKVKDILKDTMPDLIICDLKMPEESGFDFFKERLADASLRQIPVIACSSYGSRQVIRALKEFEIDDFIVKPIKQTWIIQKVRRALRDANDLVYRFSEDEGAPEIDITIEGEMVRINEMNCVVRAPMRMNTSMQMKVESVLFTENSIQCNKLESGVVPPVPVGPGLYDTQFMLLGITDVVAQKLRALMNKWRS